MSEETEEIGKIGLTLLMRVSRQGGGLYLYLPKDVARTFGLRGGDLVEAELGKIRREKRRQGGGEKVGKKDRRDD